MTEETLKEAPNLILFDNTDDLLGLLDSLGFSVRENDTIFDSDGKRAICDGCEEEITVNNLGSLMPGYSYCDKPGCDLKYFARTL